MVKESKLPDQEKIEKSKPSTPEKTREEKRAIVKIVYNKVFDMASKKNIVPYNKIIEFTKKFRVEHPDANKFLLLHDLIGSGLPPELESSYPLDTDTKEIEKFVEELKKSI